MMSHCQTNSTGECDVLSSNTEAVLVSDEQQRISKAIRSGEISKAARESSPSNDHRTREDSYKGSTCGQSLIESEYRCSICGEKYSSWNDLNLHCKIHSEEEKNKCGVNNLSLTKTDSTTLTTHMRAHTGERPYKCTVCDKCFTVSSNLTDHMRTHTGEKPYKCTVCEKCFSRNSILTCHMRTHTAQFP